MAGWRCKPALLAGLVADIAATGRPPRGKARGVDQEDG
jgi:hypothetical protein